MMEQLKRYWEIAKLALLQEKAAKDSKIKGMNEHEKEFLPAVLEVTEMPPSHAARLLTYVIMLMFTTLILWSILGKIDIIATSAGKLMPASNIKTIQTLTDSEIEEIYVQEGQYVKEGQDLIKFNQTEVLANINRVENEMEALEIAISRLKADDNIKDVKESSRYSTAPYGGVATGEFVNSAVKISTLYSPFELLSVISQIETDGERVRSERWGNRTLDIDVIFYDDCVISANDLCVPHIDMQNRAFVLEPLCELCPNKLHPILKKRVCELKSDLDNRR